MDEPVEQFARLYDEHVWTIYGFFGYRLGSREDAEDLTQLTFERALKAWGRFDPERAGVGTWLLAIARNLLIDYHRADRSDRLEPLGDGLQPDYEPAGGLPETVLGLDPALEAALDRLDERERELLALRFGGDLNGPEIAGLTGLSLANVQQILSRTLRRLRYELEVGPYGREGDTAVLPGDPGAGRQA
jgi:RNA polymerase sigma-70 factor (ECF subfamily)